MTKQELDTRLRSAVKDAATRLVPTVGTAALQEVSVRRVRRHRSQLWSGAGVLATAAAVAIGLVVTRTDAPGPRSLPAASSDAIVGPAVSDLPYLSPQLTTWTKGVSFSSSTNGWALGTRCASATAKKCPTILAHTVDAGVDWTFAPSSSVLSQAVAVLAGRKGIWAITGNSNTLWFSGNGAKSWKKLQAGAIASYRVVNGRLVAYVHGSVDRTVGACAVKVSRVVFDGDSRVDDEALSDDVLGGEGASQVGLDGSVWRSLPGTYACSHSTAANGNLKLQVAPPGKNFGGLHPVPSPSTGAWDIAAMSGSTAEALIGTRVVETNDSGISWKTAGKVELGQLSPEFVGLVGNRLLLESGGTFADLRVQVRDSSGRLTDPLTIGSPPPPPPSTKFGTVDAPTVDAVVNPTSTEIGLLFRGRFVLSTDAGRTWHSQGTLPS